MDAFLDVVDHLCRHPIDTPERPSMLHRAIDHLLGEGRSPGVVRCGPFTRTIEKAIDVVLAAAIQGTGQPFDAVILALVRHRIVQQRRSVLNA